MERIHFSRGNLSGLFLPLLKRVYSKRKEFAPHGVDPFQKQLEVQKSKTGSHIFSHVKNDGKSTKYIIKSPCFMHALVRHSILLNFLLKRSLFG